MLALCLLLAWQHGWAQTSPFQVAIVPLAIPGMPGLQSFAHGQHGGEWLLLGGRTDGLHRRQPFAAFDSAGHNYELVVVSPMTQAVWSAPMTGLPTEIRAHLSATNQQFSQRGRYLYVVGGYGYSPTAGDHVTYDRLTAIDVPGVIAAVKGRGELAPFFRQVTDARFQVTGGQLSTIDGAHYLIGGHHFGGRYNPMGPDKGPGFFQRYNHTLQRFHIDDDGQSLQVRFLEAWTDSAHFHRRDYNLVPQIYGQREGLMIFSGVFQTKADIPFLNCTEVYGDVLVDCHDFQQHYQQYHCAHVPLYAASTDEMHTLFLGGIGTYYDSAGIHVLDYGVPFVKTIARVTQGADGMYNEYRLPVEMPAFLGAGASFIPVPDLPIYPNGVVHLDSLPAAQHLIGYVVGGIQSSDDNIFWVNEGAHSQANAVVYQVFLSQSPTAPPDHLNAQSHSRLGLEVLPNPYKSLLKLDFYHAEYGPVHVSLADARGKIVLREQLKAVPKGQQHLELSCKRLKKGGRFLLRIEVDGAETVLGLVVEP